MATGLDRLTAEAARRFFPAPNEAKVRSGLRPDATAPREYNSQFWYPKQGGIDRLVHGLARGINDIRLLREAAEVNLAEHTLRTRDGGEHRWERLFSSMPLPWLCRITGDPQLVDLARGLTHSSTVCLNLGLRGPLPADLADVHWIYIADRAIPFYRVGFYSNISRGTCPPDCSAAYVEIGIMGTVSNSLARIQSDALAALHKLGWINPDSVLCSAIHLMPCAYVHHTPARRDALAIIFQRLRAAGIHPIGRYGLWDHMSMEDSIASALAAVND